MSIIRKRAFPEVPTEKCDYCKNLEKQLQIGYRTLQWENTNFFPNETAIKYYQKEVAIVTEIEKKVSDCDFPYCKGCKRGERERSKGNF